MPLAETPLRETQGLEPDIITNRLDEQEHAYVMAEEIARQRSQTAATLRARRDYVFRPPTVEERLRQVAGQSLSGWSTGPEATTPSDIATRDALRERYLTPQVVSMTQYLARLNDQARGASVPSMRTIPILLHPGETESENDDNFIEYVHRIRRLRSICSTSKWRCSRYPLRAKALL